MTRVKKRGHHRIVGSGLLRLTEYFGHKSLIGKIRGSGGWLQSLLKVNGEYVIEAQF